MAEDFIERVVSSNILRNHAQLPLKAENSTRMQTARTVEAGLHCLNSPRQCRHHRRVECRFGIDRRCILKNRVERRLATESATRRTENVTGQAVKIDREFRPHL